MQVKLAQKKDDFPLPSTSEACWLAATLGKGWLGSASPEHPLQAPRYWERTDGRQGDTCAVLPPGGMEKLLESNPSKSQLLNKAL